ncbi:hypothetical protein DL98DRAFT_617369 [Cadophora sp. DSE1049]|nr:hypothetical protein DL98DRAFT_617369 [Cadophora sp. DSE1049]
MNNPYHHHVIYDFLVPRSLLPGDMSRPNPHQDSRTSNLHLGPQILAENEKQFDYGFDFAVYRGTDSGYYSRETHGTEQTPDACHTSTSEDPSRSDAAAGLTSHAENVGPHVEGNALFRIGESYPAYVEDQDSSLMAYDSTFFDEAMSGSVMQDHHSP